MILSVRYVRILQHGLSANKMQGTPPQYGSAWYSRWTLASSAAVSPGSSQSSQPCFPHSSAPPTKREVVLHDRHTACKQVETHTASPSPSNHCLMSPATTKRKSRRWSTPFPSKESRPRITKANAILRGQARTARWTRILGYLRMPSGSIKLRWSRRKRQAQSLRGAQFRGSCQMQAARNGSWAMVPGHGKYRFWSTGSSAWSFLMVAQKIGTLS
jgi:hypothetical protein